MYRECPCKKRRCTDVQRVSLQEEKVYCNICTESVPVGKEGVQMYRECPRRKRRCTDVQTMTITMKWFYWDTQ